MTGFPEDAPGAPPRARGVALATLLAVGLGLALRLAFGLGYWVDKPLTHDEQEYLELARNLAAGRGFTYDPPAIAAEGAGAQQFGRAPLYPAFLALFVDGEAPQPTGVPRVVKVAQSFIGAATVWLIGLIGARAAGRTAGITAGALAAAYPPLIWTCGYALTEALYGFLAMASVVLLQRAIDERAGPPAGAGRAAWIGAAAGLVTGAATLTRPAMILFPTVAGLWLIAKGRARLALALLLGAIVVIAPWTYRNAREHGRFVLVASEGGVTFWTGNHPLARGEGDMAANPAIKMANLELRRQHPALGPEALEPVYYREALAYIVRHPVWWLGLLARKAFYLAVPIGPSYMLHSTRYLMLSWISYGLVLPLGLAGFLALRRASRPVALWLLAGSAVLVCLVFFPQERFRIPVIDPALLIGAAAYLAAWIAPLPAGRAPGSRVLPLGTPGERS